MEATVVDGNGTETGHIIVTTIGGRNGQPKQVGSAKLLCCYELVYLQTFITYAFIPLKFCTLFGRLIPSW